MELLPFGVPKGVEVRGRISEVFGRGGAGTAGGDLGNVFVGRSILFGMAGAFAELVGDFPAGDLQEPTFEGVLGGIVLEVGHFLGNGEECVLEGFFGFVIIEPGFARDAEDQTTVSLMELLPTNMVRIFQCVEKARARGQWIVVRHSVMGQNG